MVDGIVVWVSEWLIGWFVVYQCGGQHSALGVSVVEWVVTWVSV